MKPRRRGRTHNGTTRNIINAVYNAQKRSSAYSISDFPLCQTEFLPNDIVNVAHQISCC